MSRVSLVDAVEVGIHPPDEPAAHILIILGESKLPPLSPNSEAASLFKRNRIARVHLSDSGSWWSDRVCPTFHAGLSAEKWLLHRLLPTLEQRFPAAFRSKAICGNDVGGQGALRLAFKHPSVFPIAAASNASIDHFELYGTGSSLDALYASREQCRQDSATLHVHPVRKPNHIYFCADPANRWFRGNDRLHEKLAALGIEHRFEPGATEPGTMFEFVAEALAGESRRLL